MLYCYCQSLTLALQLNVTFDSPCFPPCFPPFILRHGQSGDTAVREQEGLWGGKELLHHVTLYMLTVFMLLAVLSCPFISSLLLHQWISTINNISKRIYLSENAEVCVLLLSLIPLFSLTFLITQLFDSKRVWARPDLGISWPYWILIILIILYDWIF